MKVYRSRIDEDGVRHITVNGEPLEMSTVLNEELPDLSLSILADYFADIAALWFSWSYHKDFAIRLSLWVDNWTLTSGDVERLLGIPPNSILHTITKTVDQKRSNTEKPTKKPLQECLWMVTCYQCLVSSRCEA